MKLDPYKMRLTPNPMGIVLAEFTLMKNGLLEEAKAVREKYPYLFEPKK